jgi:hypothetical protein
MNRMITTTALLAVLIVLNGCGTDNSADLLEAKEKMIKELDSVKSQLSAVVATEAATSTKLDAVTKMANIDNELVRANGRDSRESKLELDALKRKVALLESQLAAGKQAKRGSADHSGHGTAENEGPIGSDNGRTTE